MSGRSPPQILQWWQELQEVQICHPEGSQENTSETKGQIDDSIKFLLITPPLPTNPRPQQSGWWHPSVHQICRRWNNNDQSIRMAAAILLPLPVINKSLLPKDYDTTKIIEKTRKEDEKEPTISVFHINPPWLHPNFCDVKQWWGQVKRYQLYHQQCIG